MGIFFLFFCFCFCVKPPNYFDVNLQRGITWLLVSVLFQNHFPVCLSKKKIPSQRNVCVFYPAGALEFCNTCLCSDWLGSNMPLFGSCSLQHSISLSFSSLIAPPSSPYQIITSWQGRGNGSSFTSCIRMRCNLSAISGVIQQPPGRSSVLSGHCSLELIMERLVPH